MRTVAMACALLLASGCGPGEPGPGDEAILVDPDHRLTWVLLNVDPTVEPSGVVKVPVGTKVRVVEERHDRDETLRGDRLVNVLEGPYAGTAGRIDHRQLGPAR